MRSYWKIFWRVAKMSWMVTASYKIDLLVGYTTSFIYFLAHLGMIYFLFQMTEDKTIAGFGQFEFYFVFGMLEILWFICFGFFYINSKKLSERIVEGTLDFYLIKPKNSLFQVLFQEVDLEDMVAVFFYFLLTLGLVHYSQRWEWFMDNIFSIVLIEIFSIFLLFLLIWISALLNFYWQRFLMMRQMILDFSDISHFPKKIYPAWMQQLFLWLFPVLLMVSPIYELYNGGLDAWFWLNVFLEIVALTLIFLLMWRDGIRRYCSAG